MKFFNVTTKKAFGIPKAFFVNNTILFYYNSTFRVYISTRVKNKIKKSCIIFLTLFYPLINFVFPSFYFPQN